MRMFKRVLATLLVVAMLASMAIVVSAEETALIEAEVKNSITTPEDTQDGTGKGLAFYIQMNIRGAQIDGYNNFINTNAVATVDGVEYKVVKMGAVMANQAADIANMANLTLDDVTGYYVLDIQAKYLCEEPTADSCAFAVRIKNLPPNALGRAVGCRPYVILEKDGEQTTIYGEVDIATFNQVLYQNEPEKIPELNVAVPEVDDRLAFTAAAATYVNYDLATYEEAFKVNLTLANVSTNALSSDGDYVSYVCKDANGNELSTVTVAVDALNPGATKNVEIYVPVATASIEKSESNLNYIPVIALPEIGSDIDVTKQKNRIRVSATEASFNEDGTIHVKLTFKNYTSNWITEETDYIRYNCYDADENVLDLDPKTSAKYAVLYIGVIDTKKHPVKTFEFDVPANAAYLDITYSKIVYWTEWA